MRIRNLLLALALLIAGVGLSTPPPVTAQVPGNCFWECNCSVSCSKTCFYYNEVRIEATCGDGFLCTGSPAC